MIPLSSQYPSFKENSVQGRYVIHDQIDVLLEKWTEQFTVRTLGESVQGRSIKSIVLGTGKSKILMWSQMHGNEATTTKAVLDLINYLGTENMGAKTILKNCSLEIIPMLNPDGAAAYTRVNANKVDLNRDAQKRTQPESRALRRTFDDFRPDYCFNLHDQRTIYNVGNTPKPATVSFLAPAQDEARSVSPSRAESMQLIAAMNTVLQQHIPGQVGRYDDAFNADCVGDTFQMTGTPTILFEAGHYPNDYVRERTREYIFYAMVSGLNAIGEDRPIPINEEQYTIIPENQKLFFDVLIRNAHHIDPSMYKGGAIGILYAETLKNGIIEFIPEIAKTGDLNGYFGHDVYDTLIESDLKTLKQSERLTKILPDF